MAFSVNPGVTKPSQTLISREWRENLKQRQRAGKMRRAGGEREEERDDEWIDKSMQLISFKSER
eukprot:751922-Hanusia_phi.AAC.5